MNKFLCFFAVFLISYALPSLAQEWKWGLSPQSYSTISSNGFFAGPSTVDISGNTIMAVTGVGLDSTTFGTSYLITRPTLTYQTIIVKANASGSFLWYLATQQQRTAPVGIVTNSVGEIYLLGLYFNSITIGPYALSAPVAGCPYYLAKIAPDGNVIWAENITSFGVSYLAQDRTYGGLGIDKDDNIYVTGIFDWSSILFGRDSLFNSNSTGSSTDFFVAKFDKSGSRIWMKSYGGNDSEFAYSMSVTQAGNIFIAGTTSSPSMTIGSTTVTNTNPHSVFNTFVSKFNTNGDPLWTNTVTGTRDYNDIGALTTDEDENAYITGRFKENILSFGSVSLTNSDTTNSFIVKYDANGQCLWANAINGISKGSAITVDKCGNIWMCGSMRSRLQFGSEILDYPAIPQSPLFIAHYDTAGNYLNSMAFAQGNTISYNSINFDGHGNFIVSGNFFGGNLAKSPLVFGLDTVKTDQGFLSFYIAQYKYANDSSCKLETLIPTKPKIIQDIFLFPNPTTMEFTIQSKLPFSSNSYLNIYDITGRLIQSTILTGTVKNISVGLLTSGMYFCKIYDNNVLVATKKLSVNN